MLIPLMTIREGVLMVCASYSIPSCWRNPFAAARVSASEAEQDAK